MFMGDLPAAMSVSSVGAWCLWVPGACIDEHAGSPGPIVTVDCKQLRGDWDLNFGLLEEQPVLF